MEKEIRFTKDMDGTAGIGRPDWLRTYKGCEHYSEEEAVKILQTLDKLTIILFDFTCQQNGIVIDNQIVINSRQEKSINKAA